MSARRLRRLLTPYRRTRLAVVLAPYRVVRSVEVRPEPVAERPIAA